jgi:hypothetical protein
MFEEEVDMAKVRNNIVMQGLSGMLGDQLVLKQDKAGRTIVSVKPTFDPNRTFSEEQQAVHDNFREATAYAKSAKSNEVYAAKVAGTPQSTYNLAVADWFHAPEILEIDVSAWNGAAGELIRVKAADDVKVTQVTLLITDGTGAVLEQGQATQAEGFWWSYITTATAPEGAKIVASARDLPGHIAQMNWE